MSNLDQMLFKRLRALRAPETGNSKASKAHVATVLANLSFMGAQPTQELVEAIHEATSEGLRVFNRDAQQLLHGALGGYATHLMRPLFPHFPAETMESRESGLFLSALPAKLKNDEPLVENGRGVLWHVGVLANDAEETLLRQLLTQPAAHSPEDQDVLRELLTGLPGAHDILRQTDEIPNKENLARIYGLVEDRSVVVDKLATATDVLRAATALAGGDPSLAEHTRLGNLSKAARRELLGALERIGNVLEDMARNVPRWKRLGEKLHPGEYAKRFPNTAEAFKRLRQGDLPQSFDGKVDAALAGPIDELTALLKQRPGVFTRRLDALLRARPADAQALIQEYSQVGEQVATPVLLQAHAHFVNRDKDRTSRVYFPKGSTAKPWVATGSRPALSANSVDAARTQLAESLTEKFSALDRLGKVWIDPKVDGMKIPLQVRDASTSLRTVGRGSRVPMPDQEVIRGFMWWMDKDGNRVDLDLSAMALTEDLKQVAAVTYYDLEESRTGMRHSGDFTSAPKPDGAAEFVDIPIAPALAAGVRYVILTVHSFSGQLFAELEGAFAGVQAVQSRQGSNHREVFSLSEVADRFDLTADAQVFTPIAFDLKTRESIWLDLPSRPRLTGPANLANTTHSVTAPLEAMLDSDAPSLRDLFELHAAARGALVDDREDADFVIAEDGDLSPFNVAEILTDWVG